MEELHYRLHWHTQQLSQVHLSPLKKPDQPALNFLLPTLGGLWTVVSSVSLTVYILRGSKLLSRRTFSRLSKNSLTLVLLKFVSLLRLLASGILTAMLGNLARNPCNQSIPACLFFLQLSGNLAFTFTAYSKANCLTIIVVKPCWSLAAVRKYSHNICEHFLVVAVGLKCVYIVQTFGPR